MKGKAVRAFKEGLLARGLLETQVHQAYIDTLKMTHDLKSTPPNPSPLTP